MESQQRGTPPFARQASAQSVTRAPPLHGRVSAASLRKAESFRLARGSSGHIRVGSSGLMGSEGGRGRSGRRGSQTGSPLVSATAGDLSAGGVRATSPIDLGAQRQGTPKLAITAPTPPHGKLRRQGTLSRRASSRRGSTSSAAGSTKSGVRSVTDAATPRPLRRSGTGLSTRTPQGTSPRSSVGRKDTHSALDATSSFRSDVDDATALVEEEEQQAEEAREGGRPGYDGVTLREVVMKTWRLEATVKFYTFVLSYRMVGRATTATTDWVLLEMPTMSQFKHSNTRIRFEKDVTQDEPKRSKGMDPPPLATDGFMLTFYVMDLAAIMSHVEEADCGARVLRSPYKPQGLMNMAVLADPNGIPIYVLQHDAAFTGEHENPRWARLRAKETGVDLSTREGAGMKETDWQIRFGSATQPCDDPTADAKWIEDLFSRPLTHFLAVELEKLESEILHHQEQKQAEETEKAARQQLPEDGGGGHSTGISAVQIAASTAASRGRQEKLDKLKWMARRSAVERAARSGLRVVDSEVFTEVGQRFTWLATGSRAQCTSLCLLHTEGRSVGGLAVVKGQRLDDDSDDTSEDGGEQVTMKGVRPASVASETDLTGAPGDVTPLMRIVLAVDSIVDLIDWLSKHRGIRFEDGPTTVTDVGSWVTLYAPSGLPVQLCEFPKPTASKRRARPRLRRAESGPRLDTMADAIKELWQREHEGHGFTAPIVENPAGDRVARPKPTAVKEDLRVVESSDEDEPYVPPRPASKASSETRPPVATGPPRSAARSTATAAGRHSSSRSGDDS